MEISVASKTEKCRRPENEDAYLVLTDIGGLDGLYIVADGMGGRSSGAVASSLAVEAVRDAVVSGLTAGCDPADAIRQGLQAANDAVYKKAEDEPEFRGMGTTCVAAAIEGDRIYLAHMGDSRAYLLREGRLRQLTEDHSFVAEKVRAGEITEEQAHNSRFRNVITRAIGLEPTANPAIGSFDIEPGDVFLMCTDGLSGPVKDSEIADILCMSENVEEACGRLVNAAVRNGGSDNITVVVAAYGAKARTPIREREPVKTLKNRSISWTLPAFLFLMIGIAIGIYAGQNYFTITKKPTPQIDLAHVTYGDPVSLAYTPLQGKILALDPKGFLSAVDQQGQLMRIDTSGQVVYTFPARATLKQTEIKHSPMAATDRQGNLYISDPAGKRIMKFDSDGLFLGDIGAGKLSGPEALEVDRKGVIYVIDSGRLKAILPNITGETDGSINGTR